jgi:hypothetical protein
VNNGDKSKIDGSGSSVEYRGKSIAELESRDAAGT